MKMFKKPVLVLLALFVVITFIHIDGFVSVQAAADIEGSGERIAIYFNGSRAGNSYAYTINSGIYVPTTMIGIYMKNPGITVDEKNRKIVIDITKQNLLLENQEVTDFVKQNMIQASIPLRYIDNQCYFPLDVLESFFNVTYELSGRTLFIEKGFQSANLGKINKGNVRVKPSVLDEKSEDLVLKNNEIVQILKESDNYYKVLSQDGITCFVPKTDIDMLDANFSELDFYNFKRDKTDYSKSKISIVWEYVYQNTPLPDEEKNDAVDIISPTWFYIEDAQGNVANKADKGYLNHVKSLGYEVWGLTTNSFNPDWTHKILNNEALTKKVAAQLLFYASLYNLDGINIDFESVKDEDRNGLTNFVSLMRYYTEKQGLYLSVDVLIPTAWSIEYDYAALSKLVDYIAVMTYDEHWSSSQTAGSVASLNWVENAVNNSLKMIPSEKILLGVPLYTRLWAETKTNGTTTVTSVSQSMEQVRQLISDKNLSVKWLDKEKQYYIEYAESGKTYKVWIEDSRSIAHKLELIRRYGLGGSAAWRKGFEEKKVWRVFEDIVKNNVPASEYKNMDY